METALAPGSERLWPRWKEKQNRLACMHTPLWGCEKDGARGTKNSRVVSQQAGSFKRDDDPAVDAVSRPVRKGRQYLL